MIEIDGAQGEGGGQILRSALALSICTDQPFRMVNVRAKRAKPGLMRQHLTALQAAAKICSAKVTGDAVGSCEISFAPGKVVPGEYAFSIGTAGSTTLVLQTVLPPLMTATGPSVIRITGGTHNKACPPVDFLQRAFLPLVQRMGPKIRVDLVRHGFYPRGGGEIVVTINPSRQLTRLDLMSRGERRGGFAEAHIAGVPLHVASRELDIVGKMLNWPTEQLHVRGLSGELGPGNALTITVEHEAITEVFTGFGEKGVSAESVAKAAVGEVRRYLASTAAVGQHLADQIMLPMALQGGGEFTTLPVTEHFKSHADVIKTFLNRQVSSKALDGVVAVTV